MADGPAGFTQGSTCPALLRIPLGFMTLRVRDCHPLRSNFPERSTRVNLAVSRSYNPRGAGTPRVWAVPRSLATTWGITFCFSLPPGTKMFQFPGFAPIPGMGDGPSARRVAPFGNPWVTGRLHLTTAYRSLPRPSSPSRAKASAVRPFLLSPRPCRQPSSRRHGTCLRPTEHHRADGPRISR